jgi:peptide/nickel transport system permease protein
VASLIGDVLPHTLALALTSLGMAIVLGLPLGVIAAAQPGGWLDQVLGAISITFVTLPTYVIGLVGLLVFAVGLGWLPAIGAGDAADPADYLRHLILPASALALTWVGYLARLVRASMLEVLSAPFIRTARAYGLPEWRVLFRHALRNALIPTVAVLGVGLGNLLGGAIFVEFIFDRPGLGQLIFTSIGERNYPVVRGGVLTAALMFVLANLLADLVQRWLNPRLRSR